MWGAVAGWQQGLYLEPQCLPLLPLHTHLHPVLLCLPAGRGGGAADAGAARGAGLARHESNDPVLFPSPVPVSRLQLQLQAGWLVSCMHRMCSCCRRVVACMPCMLRVASIIPVPLPQPHRLRPSLPRPRPLAPPPLPAASRLSALSTCLPPRCTARWWSLRCCRQSSGWRCRQKQASSSWWVDSWGLLMSMLPLRWLFTRTDQLQLAWAGVLASWRAACHPASGACMCRPPATRCLLAPRR